MAETSTQVSVVNSVIYTQDGITNVAYMSRVEQLMWLFTPECIIYYTQVGIESGVIYTPGGIAKVSIYT